ncbi:hypothetical protein HPB47_006593 [Ixodes persulcatus]|uniref:Uncharacterized protein n=1 Tax=Ixodes persulcatus TaxID=34615 RepID=A0AC60PAD5_IXOPE|nr:hypothetical protein HPB47_006593 [Ixodes persulcatus]
MAVIWMIVVEQQYEAGSATRKTNVYEKRGAEVAYCLTRGALKGPNLPRARLHHQDALYSGHDKAKHSRTMAGEPAWLGDTNAVTKGASEDPAQVAAPPPPPNGRCYTSQSLGHFVTACCAMNLPPSIAHISDHRPVLVELRFNSAVSYQRAWCLDTRLLRDKTSRDCRRKSLRRSLHGAAPDLVTFDWLQESWRVACKAEGCALHRRHAEQLRDTSL